MPIGKSFAYLHFSESKTELHRLWVEKGFVGKGRIVLRNKNVSELKHFTGKELSRIKLVNSSLKNSDISFSKFNEAELINCDLSNCHLHNVYFNRAIIQNSDFRDTELDSNLYEAQIVGNNFSNCELSCCFNKATIENCDFYNTEFKVSMFPQARINQGNWNSCNLSKPNFEGAKIDGVDFANSLMRRATLDYSRMTNCNFQYTDLSSGAAHSAVWENCDFRGANFKDFQFEKVILKNCGFYNSAGNPLSFKEIQIINPDFSENFDGSNILDKKDVIKQWKKEIPQIVKDKIRQREVITRQKQSEKIEKETRKYNKLYDELLELHQKIVVLYCEDLLQNELIEKEKEIAGADDAYIQSWGKIADIVTKIMALYEDWYDDEYSDLGIYSLRDWDDYNHTYVQEEAINVYEFLTNELGLIVESYSQDENFSNILQASEVFTLFYRLYDLCTKLYDELIGIYQELLS